MIEITDGNLDLRNNIRNIRNNNPSFVPVSLSILENIKVEPLDKATMTTVGVGAETEGDGPSPKCFGTRYCYPIEDDFSFDLCQPLTRYIHIQSGVTCHPGTIYAYEDPWDSPIQVTINWGDGTSSTIQIMNGHGKDDINISSIPHTYPAAGNYIISVSGFRVSDQSALSANSGQLGLDISTSCYPDQVTSGRVWINSSESGSNKRAFSSQLIMSNKLGNAPWGRARICSITKSYKWTGSVWKSHKVSRLVSIFNSSHRGSATDCNIYKTQFKSVWPYNSKHAEAVGTENYKYIKKDDIYSDHRMYHNSNQYQYFHFLVPPGC